MTDLPLGPDMERLGVGGIVGGTLSLFFNRIGSIFMLAFLPALIVVVFEYQLTPPVDLENRPDLDPGQFSRSGKLLSGLISMIGTSLISALTVRLAYDEKVGNPMRPGAYVSSAFSVVVPLVFCSILTSIVAGIGLLLLVIPGLWVLAVFCCVTPAIVIEKIGFGSFDRSALLTKEYRWPCLGALIIVQICAYIPLSVVYSFYVMGLASSAFAQGAVLILLDTIATVIFMAMTGICTALIYARLREIKEGTRVEQLAEIFA
jgi:hypothetical protein